MTVGDTRLTGGERQDRWIIRKHSKARAELVALEDLPSPSAGEVGRALETAFEEIKERGRHHNEMRRGEIRELEVWRWNGNVLYCFYAEGAKRVVVLLHVFLAATEDAQGWQDACSQARRRWIQVAGPRP